MDAKTLQLAVTGLTPQRAALWADPVSAAMDEWGVDTPARQAAFLAQVGHESGSFRYTAEIWGPTAAQSRYEGRKDLGNTQPGDGSRYRGRGPIQLTGRKNYQLLSDALGVDFVSHPELLELPVQGARAAGWFWQTNGLNDFADRGDFEGLTRRINGGLNGLEDRTLRWTQARLALGVPT